MIGDFSARISKEDAYQPKIGKYSIHEESNNNATTTIDFSSSKDFVVRRTTSPHKNIYHL